MASLKQEMTMNKMENNERPECSSDILNFFIGKNDVETVNLILNKYKVKIKDYSLLKAVRAKSSELVNLCIEQGADVNCMDCLQETPLLYAVDDESIDIIKLLLKAGADVNISDPDSSPLVLAVKKGNKEIIKLLLDYGADVNLIDEDGYKALYIAMIKNNEDIVNLLLDKAKIELDKELVDIANNDQLNEIEKKEIIEKIFYYRDKRVLSSYKETSKEQKEPKKESVDFSEYLWEIW